MKHLFTVLAWAVPAAGLFLACAKKPAGISYDPRMPQEWREDYEGGEDLKPIVDELPALDLALPPAVALYFDLGRADLRDDGALADAAAVLLGQADTRARIEGHACPLGPEPVNERLSRARAQAVADWLEAAGVPAARLAAEGLAARRPVARDPALYHLNRRAIITFERSIP